MEIFKNILFISSLFFSLFGMVLALENYSVASTILLVLSTTMTYLMIKIENISVHN